MEERVPVVKPLPRISEKEGFQDALAYLEGRMVGKIKSLSTPWKKIDDAMVDGLEWQNTIIVGARPGTGKTLFMDQLIKGLFDKNPTENFRVLKFQLEMTGKVAALREFSAFSEKSYKSVVKDVNYDSLKAYWEYSQKRIKYPVVIVNEQPTVSEFKATVIDELESNSYEEEGVKKYIPYIVTLDHSKLLKRDRNEKDDLDMLYNFGMAITDLKRKYPIIFIIISQLNRNIESQERSQPGTYGNYINSSDIFGSDALLQHADLVIGINRPSNQKINIYGPERFIIDDDNILAFHFIKARNGDTRLSFFRAEYDKMRIVEIDPPARSSSSKK